jgi:hypothetical protein
MEVSMATYSAPQKQAGRAPIIGLNNVRKDNWRAAPMVTVATFLVFILYSTYRAFAGSNFSTFNHEGQNFPWVANHLAGMTQPHYWSPFYSPYLPSYFPFLNDLKYPFLGAGISAALYVLIIPLSFRATCYYCRKAYYRAIFGDPTACAVKEKFARMNYKGETTMPNKLFNLHRFTLYLALILVGFHWYHLFEALHATGMDGQEHLYFGLGTIVIGIDTLALSAYVFSCHSFRHLTGGVLDRFSRSTGTKQRFSLWSKVSHLNEQHGLFFWASLVSVGLADLYVCLLASGVFRDLGFIIH